MRTLLRLCSILLLTTASLHSWAQTSPDAETQRPAQHFYHLVFRIQEADPDGKVINTRSYSTTAGTAESRLISIRAGSKVPIHTSTTDKGDVQYIDVGVSIDCEKPREVDGQLALSVSADFSSLPTGAPVNGVAPLLRQNRWHSEVIVPLGKPAVIFSSDNLSDKGKTQVELTATRLN